MSAKRKVEEDVTQVTKRMYVFNKPKTPGQKVIKYHVNSLEPEACQAKPVVVKPKLNEVTSAERDAKIQSLLETRFVPFKSFTREKRDYLMSIKQHLSDDKSNDKSNDKSKDKSKDKSQVGKDMAEKGDNANPIWLEARKLQITGSIAHAMAGLDRYKTPSSVICDALWDRFEKEKEASPGLKRILNFGSEHEKDAAKSTLEFLSSSVGKEFIGKLSPKVKAYHTVEHMEYGLVGSIANPWSSGSPDGAFFFKDADNNVLARSLVEFKCKTKGFTKELWTFDAWPRINEFHKFDVVEHAKIQLPMSVKANYYAQMMWCGLVLGKHSVSSMIDESCGLATHRAAFAEFMSAYLQASPTYGEDVVDNDAPIVFAVWAPGHVGDFVGKEPEIVGKYVFDRNLGAYRSALVKCPSGAILITILDFDYDYARRLLYSCFYNWRFYYLPRFALKELGALAENELDCPIKEPSSQQSSQQATQEEEEQEEEQDNKAQEGEEEEQQEEEQAKEQDEEEADHQEDDDQEEDDKQRMLFQGYAELGGPCDVE